VRVEERDGVRLLSVGGEVMGGAPVSRLASPPKGDVLVELIALAAVPGKRVLVLGLGTGRTASELAAAGASVTVVEESDAVVRAAREQFGFRGEVETGSAQEWLTKHGSERPPFDVVLLDTLGADEARDQPALEAAKVYVAARSRSASELGDGPLLALRYWGMPDDARTGSMRAALRSIGPYSAFFGSGVANEPQTIYALAGAARQNLVPPAGGAPIAAWQLPEDELGLAARRSPSGVGASASRTDASTLRLERELPRERDVELAGYLVRTEDGALCLDLPHYEMGALRYRLRGPAVLELEPLLPKKATFPTSGDIGSDGDTKRTLQSVLDGGGFKRNETRFSPVAILVRGRARLLGVVHPDASASVPKSMRGPEPQLAELHYGGSLYELDVERVLGTLDLATWNRGLPAVQSALPIAALEKGDLAKAAAASRDAQARLDALLGPIGPLVAERRYVARALAALAPFESHPPADDLGRAIACDRARVQAAIDPYHGGPLSQALAASLFTCATRHYERALGPKPSPTTGAARRLLGLWREREYFEPKLGAKADGLEKRLPGIVALDAPPSTDGLVDPFGRGE
jgi:hypothetical protein